MKKQLETTFKQEKQGLLAFIRSKIASPEDAEDLLQDIFMNTLTRLDLTEPVTNMAGYLYTAARNKITDWYRRKKNKTVSINQELAGTTLDNLLADSGISIEKDSIRNAVSEALLDCIEQLPDTQQEVIILQVIEGRTFREISESTGVPVNTLLARKRYALKRLRRQLAEVKSWLSEIS